MPSKPYPREEAVQLELESIAFTDALFKNKKASEFMDNSIIAELDRKGFFAQAAVARRDEDGARVRQINSIGRLGSTVLRISRLST